MAQIVLKDVGITINGTELSDRSNSVEVNYEVESVEVTAFGGNRSFVGGLQNNTCTVELMQDFAAANVEATIFPLVGTQTTITFEPIKSAGSPSATNPTYTITGAYLASHTPISGAVGELGMTSLTFTGGTLVKTTS
jgi:hypothetical protein